MIRLFPKINKNHFYERLNLFLSSIEHPYSRLKYKTLLCLDNTALKTVLNSNSLKIMILTYFLS